MKDRLEKYYVGKGKLNQDGNEIFKKVLIELSDDLKDGGLSRGLYKYLNTHMIDLKKKIFTRSIIKH